MNIKTIEIKHLAAMNIVYVLHKVKMEVIKTAYNTLLK
jgi:hypothetical protein